MEPEISGHTIYDKWPFRKDCLNRESATKGQKFGSHASQMAVWILRKSFQLQLWKYNIASTIVSCMVITKKYLLVIVVIVNVDDLYTTYFIVVCSNQIKLNHINFIISKQEIQVWCHKTNEYVLRTYRSQS
jgi:hypothetical protein